MTTIKSVEKAIDILSCFTTESSSLTVVEITRLTGFNQSTVSRILTTLANKRCVEHVGSSGRYQLGVKFYQWESVLRQTPNLADLARPVMEDLRDLCGEEVSLYVLNEGNRICLEAVKSRYGVAKVTTVGKVFPLHCGAAGKVLLAYLPEKARRDVLRRKGLEKYTATTMVDAEALEADLAKIRLDGYAVSLGEREEGAYSVVAPIRDVRGEVVASLSISGPIYRFSEEKRGENVRAVARAAEEIESVLEAANLHHLSVAAKREKGTGPAIRPSRPKNQNALQLKSGIDV